MQFKTFAKQIIQLKEADLELRATLIDKQLLGDGYHAQMEALHIENTEALEKIIASIGYPSISKVGQEASEAAWLIIQHSISRPTFMKKCLTLLEQAADAHDVDAKNIAYLSDRIAVFEGRPQLYGTQFDWDENGKLSPQPFDDANKVNRRRKNIGFNTLEEQIQIIRKQADRENQGAPPDFEKRKKQYEAWRRKVGWVK